MAETISSQLEKDAIAGVQRVTADGVSVDAMSVEDRIKAEEHLAQKTAKTKNHCGITFRTMVPGGCG